MDADVEIRTARLRLLSWRESHRDAFAAMHANPEVMADLGGPIDRTSSDANWIATSTPTKDTELPVGRWKAAMAGFSVMRA